MNYLTAPSFCTFADPQFCYPDLPKAVGYTTTGLRTMMPIEEEATSREGLTLLLNLGRFLETSFPPNGTEAFAPLPEGHKRVYWDAASMYTVAAHCIAPIRRTPTELLASIFLFVTGSATTCEHRDLFAIMQTCHRWREIVKGSTSFWRNIEYRAGDTQCLNTSNLIIPMWIEYSRDAPLNVTIAVGYGIDDIDIETDTVDTVELLLKQSHRMKTLTLLFEATSCLLEAAFRLAGGLPLITVIDSCAPHKALIQFPVLEVLDLIEVDSISDETPKIGIFASVIYAPCVKTLLLGNRLWLDYESYAALVEATPNVTHLHFRNGVDTFLHRQEAPSCHKRLQYLEFEGDDPDIHQNTILLRHLASKVPSLTHVKLSGKLFCQDTIRANFQPLPQVICLELEISIGSVTTFMKQKVLNRLKPIEQLLSHFPNVDSLRWKFDRGISKCSKRLTPCFIATFSRFLFGLLETTSHISSIFISKTSR